MHLREIIQEKLHTFWGAYHEYSTTATTVDLNKLTPVYHGLVSSRRCVIDPLSARRQALSKQGLPNDQTRQTDTFLFFFGGVTRIGSARILMGFYEKVQEEIQGMVYACSLTDWLV